VLKAAFAQGRLAKAEFEAHVGRALTSRTHAGLAAITAGIAAPPSTAQPPDPPSPVREQRTRRKISQAGLAKSLGVSRQTVIMIENGGYLPSLLLGRIHQIRHQRTSAGRCLPRYRARPHRYA